MSPGLAKKSYDGKYDARVTSSNLARKILSKYRKNLLLGKRCDNPCVSCNADGTLLGINHSEKWKKIYKI